MRTEGISALLFSTWHRAEVAQGVKLEEHDPMSSQYRYKALNQHETCRLPSRDHNRNPQASMPGLRPRGFVVGSEAFPKTVLQIKNDTCKMTQLRDAGLLVPVHKDCISPSSPQQTEADSFVSDITGRLDGENPHTQPRCGDSLQH